MMNKFSYLFSSREIPKEIRVLSLATSIRWAGWGFAETLIPVFLYTLSNTFAEASLLNSVYNIGLILALPIIGIAADRVRASTLILIGLGIYFFIGTSYLLAGITGTVLLLIFARLTNGIAFALDSIGRSTYLRRHTAPTKTATIFGYVDTISSFWWIIAALAGMVLIKYVSIASLLFLITPTSIIAFIIIWKFRKTESEPVFPIISKEEHPAETARILNKWNWTLKSLVIINFFISGAAAIIIFFLPIAVYKDGASLSMVVLFGIIATLPNLFGWKLGKLFDTKSTQTFIYGLLLFALLIFSIPFFEGFEWKLLVVFLVGLIVEFLFVGNSELITIHSSPEHFGKIDGMMRSISNVGALVGPLVMGIALDSFGITGSYLALSALLLTLSAIFYILYRYGFLKSLPDQLK